MKDYKKAFKELGFDHERTFVGSERYINQWKTVSVSFSTENEEIFDIHYIPDGYRYVDRSDLWRFLKNIAITENSLLKKGFVFEKGYIFALPDEREQKTEMSDRNRKEREI